VNRWALRMQVKRAMRQLGFSRAINWVFNPAAAVIAGTLGEETVIYYCVDEYSAFAGVTAKSLAAHASPARASLWVFGTAAAIALPAAWAIAPSGPADLAAAHARTWLVVAWLGVVATGVSYLLFSTALRFISGATGVALALGEPLTAFTLAVLLLGEPLRASGVAGIALIMAGLALVVRAER